MSTLDPSMITFGALVGVATAGLMPGCLRCVATVRRHWRQPRAALPPWLRTALPVASMLTPAARIASPAALLDHVSRRLRFADLDDHICGPQWCALCPVMAAAAAACAALMHSGSGGLLLAAAVGGAWPTLWLRDRRRRLVRELDRALPRLLELLTLAVEAGCSLGAALRISVEAGEQGALQRGLAEALRAIHAGRARADALTDLARRYEHPGLDAMVAAIAHADASGAGIGGTLRAQTIQRTEERFARAERLAMESPVKMLGPLILCIFPCAFLVIGFPIAHRLLQWSQG